MKSNIVSSSLCNIGMGILKVARAAAVAHGIPAGVVPPDDVFNEMSTRQGGSPTTVKPSPLPDDLRAQLHSTANEKVGETTYRAVPSSRTARAAGFGSLLIRLGWDKFVGARESGQMLSVSSHQRIVETLCRMRGAVLKLGQMLSIQDDSVVPAHVTRLFERVRDSAYAMPTYQLNQTMTKEYDNNPNWQKDLFESFDEKPIAAASIGQVHRATVRDQDSGEPTVVAVKVQYPGVAQSIDSDVANLRMLMTLNILPPGMFVGNILQELQQELETECSYTQEAQKQVGYATLLQRDKVLREIFVVPKVYESLSTDHILVTQMLPGVSIDKVISLQGAQHVRDYIARSLLRLTLVELFQWRFMQTDPNFSNFLFCPDTNKIGLIDFGAARDYSEEFVKDYLEVVAAAARGDRLTIIEKSISLGFLTGNEMKEMLDAHTESVLLLGKPFRYKDKPYDFSLENLPALIRAYVPTIVKLRLCPPPTPVYSLHRRLSGAILLSTKLKATIPSGEIFWSIYSEVTGR